MRRGIVWQMATALGALLGCNTQYPLLPAATDAGPREHLPADVAATPDLAPDVDDDAPGSTDDALPADGPPAADGQEAPPPPEKGAEPAGMEKPKDAPVELPPSDAPSEPVAAACSYVPNLTIGEPVEQWAHGITGIVGYPKETQGPMALLPDGSLVYGGYYLMNVNFSTQPLGQDQRYSGSDGSCFISKLDKRGAYVGTWTFGVDLGSNTLSCNLLALAAGPDGSIFATGKFCSGLDFDPSSGVDVHAARDVGGCSTDVFLSKLNPDGSYGWTKTFGSPEPDQGLTLEVTQSGDIVVGGSYSDGANFDPNDAGAAVVPSNGGTDAFVAKYTAAGALAWVKTFGAEDNDQVNDVGVSADGSVVVTGEFRDTVAFGDNGTDTQKATSLGWTDVFVMRLGPDGAYKETHTFGGDVDDRGLGVTFAHDGGYAATGFFTHRADFNHLGTVPDFRSSTSGAKDAFVTKYNADGEYCWTQVIGGAGHDVGYSIAMASDGTLRVSGSYSATVDFDPGRETADPRTAFGIDGFVVALQRDGSYGGWVVVSPAGGIHDITHVALGAGDSLAVWGLDNGTTSFFGSPLMADTDDFFVGKLAPPGPP